MLQLSHVLSDRGSRYAVSGGPLKGRADAAAFITELKRSKKFAKATHHSWAALLEGVPVRCDDGEAGAGDVILRMIQREGLEGHIIVVTRWYGGVHLGGERFAHIVTCVRAYLDLLRAAGSEHRL
ncbi:MAG: YigZ family protein [Cypionkella sp.]|nr:YigZ family protein [Cypionkella sp.]